MTTKQRNPEDVMVQLQVRVPWWRREQLADIAADNGTTIPLIIVAALDRTYPPKRT